MNSEIEIIKKIYSNPPLINYAEFKKTSQEKEALKTAKKSWNNSMRSRYTDFIKRKWGQMHYIWTQ